MDQDHRGGLRGRLHFLELGSPDPERLSAFYGDVFGMKTERRGDGWLCRSKTRRLLIRAGSPNTLVTAGYAVEHPDVLAALAERTAQVRADARMPWDGLFADEPVGAIDPDGNTMAFGLAAPATQDAPEDEPSGRLQHVVLGTTNLDRMTDFYCGVVGFRLSDRVLDDEGVAKTVFLRSDDEHHSLALFQTSTNRLDHHCYEAESWNSLRDWGDRLAARRIPVKWGPGRHGPGNNLFLFFHDPDDNWLEISSELEVVNDERPVGVWPHEERTLNSWGRGYLRT